MKSNALKLVVLSVLIWPLTARSVQIQKNVPKLFVPYKDLAAVVDPAAKTVLMERQAFAQLLAAAEANAIQADSLELGQLIMAEYTAQVKGENLVLTGALTVQSLSDKPVRVPLHFAEVGLSQLSLNGAPAPLGYDKQGKLVLVVTGKGTHQLSITASGKLKELTGGGISVQMTLPPSVAANMTLSAPGDLEVNANVPVASSLYDKQADRTTAELALGGQSSLTITLLGNGRLEDQSAILLGESFTSVVLNKSHQVLHCAYTVRILRRGLRRLEFSLPQNWTVTDVASDNLVKWSIGPRKESGVQRILLQFRTGVRGTEILHIQATAPTGATARWQSPSLDLVGAAFERGYLLVDTGEELSVRAEQLTRAARQLTGADHAPACATGCVAGRVALSATAGAEEAVAAVSSAKAPGWALT